VQGRLGNRRGSSFSSGRVGNGSPPLVQLPFRFILCEAVTFLQPACKFIPFASNEFEVIIRKLGPFLLSRALYLHPLAFNLIPVHKVYLQTLIEQSPGQTAPDTPTIDR